MLSVLVSLDSPANHHFVGNECTEGPSLGLERTLLPSSKMGTLWFSPNFQVGSKITFLDIRRKGGMRLFFLMLPLSTEKKKKLSWKLLRVVLIKIKEGRKKSGHFQISEFQIWKEILAHPAPSQPIGCITCFPSYIMEEINGRMIFFFPLTTHSLGSSFSTNKGLLFFSAVTQIQRRDRLLA